MIPILYESNETAFATNGLGRLRDALDVKCSEERNGIYEVDFDYPIDGAHFEDILCGRIIAVTHDDTGDVQPFDIVSYSKPISGIVSFHAVHVSYRQNEITVQQNPKGINSLSDAFARLQTAVPSNPFTYESDITSSAYFAAADGIPRTVRQMLGGVEGSILDAYGGEFEWDNYKVIHHQGRGISTGVVIEYGKNLTKLEQDTDITSVYTDLLPYAVITAEDGTETVVTLSEVLLPIADANLVQRKTLIKDFSDAFDVKGCTWIRFENKSADADLISALSSSMNGSFSAA